MEYRVTLTIPLNSTPKNVQNKGKQLIARAVKAGYLPEGAAYVRAHRVKQSRRRPPANSRDTKLRRAGMYDARKLHAGKNFPLAPDVVTSIVGECFTIVRRVYREDWRAANAAYTQLLAQRKHRKEKGLTPMCVKVLWSTRLRFCGGRAHLPWYGVDYRRQATATVKLHCKRAAGYTADTLVHELAHILAGWMWPGTQHHGDQFMGVLHTLREHCETARIRPQAQAAAPAQTKGGDSTIKPE